MENVECRNSRFESDKRGNGESWHEKLSLKGCRESHSRHHIGAVSLGLGERIDETVLCYATNNGNVR